MPFSDFSQSGCFHGHGASSQGADGHSVRQERRVGKGPEEADVCGKGEMGGDDERGNDPVPLVFEVCESLDEREDDGVDASGVDSMVELIKAELVALRDRTCFELAVDAPSTGVYQKMENH